MMSVRDTHLYFSLMVVDHVGHLNMHSTPFSWFLHSTKKTLCYSTNLESTTLKPLYTEADPAVQEYLF